MKRALHFAADVLGKAATAAVIVATAVYAAVETKGFLVNLATFAVVALASEAFFTAITKQIRRRRQDLPIDWRLPGEPFLWSFLVYGLSATLTLRATDLWFPWLWTLAWPLRGFVYMMGIYAWEYFWGWRIEDLTGSCPWKYRESPWRVWRYVNPYYFWSWYCFGFILEFLHHKIVPALMAVSVP